MVTSNAKNWSPFNLYDFFGYLIPGLSFLVALSVYFLNHDITSDHYYLSFKHVYSDFPALMGTISIIAGVVMVYIVGHAISMVSHISIDRIMIGTIIKYPYIQLLGIEEPLKHQREIAWPMHKWIFLFGIIYLVISPLTYLGIFFLYARKITLGCLVFLVVSRLVLTIIKSTFKEIQDWQINTQSNWYKKTIGWQDKILNSLIVVPIRRFLHVDSGFDEDLQNKIKLKIENKFEIKASDCNSDIYWLPCLDVLKNEVYGKMINNWLHLFGLMRNMGTSMFIAAFIFSFSIENVLNNAGLLIVYYSSILLGILFIFRYIMLYYTYYSKNTYRMFYATSCEGS